MTRKQRKTIDDAFFGKKVDPEGAVSAKIKEVSTTLGNMPEKESETVTGLGQVGNRSIPVLEQVSNRSRTGKSNSNRTVTGQVGNRSPKSNSNRTVTVTGQVSEIKLAPNQIIIYDWFLQNGLSGEFNKPQITKDTGVRYETIRKTLRKFESLGIIKLSAYDPCSKMQEYALNPECQVKRPESNSNSNRTVTGLGQDSNRSVTGPLISSSKLFNKSLLTRARKAIDTNPELAFWKTLDLQPGKMVGWMEEFSRDFESMVRQLAYAAYQWEDLKLGKKIENHESAFYGALRKGGFSRPAGYESPQERQLRMEQEELKRQARLLAELEASRKKREELEMKIQFEQIMADPEGEAYKQLFDGLNEFEKKRASHPKKKYAAMWATFNRE